MLENLALRQQLAVFKRQYHRPSLKSADERPDVVPLEYHASPSGSFEHGEKLHSLWEQHPVDVEHSRRIPRGRPDAGRADPLGQYREIITHERSVVQEIRHFGEGGLPIRDPLWDWSGLGGAEMRPFSPAYALLNWRTFPDFGCGGVRRDWSPRA